MKKNVKRPLQILYLLATDLADFLVSKGLPFRQAHHVVGELVGLAESKGVSLTEIPMRMQIKSLNFSQMIGEKF